MPTPKIESMKDLLELQKDLSEHLQSQLKALHNRKPLTLDAAVAAKTASAESARARLAAAIRDRDAVIRHWSDRVDSLKAETANQADELKRLKKQAAASKKQASTNKKQATVSKKPASIPKKAK